MGIRRQMWFGPRGFEQWIPMPRISADMSRHGYSSKQDFLNGGAGVRRSKGGHKEYNFVFNKANRHVLRVLTDISEGIFDLEDGVNLIYFIEPMAAPVNVLPQNWASPMVAAADGMPLFADNRPTLVPTPSNQYKYPARSAQYRADRPSENIYIPIPPGYCAWVGAHGTAAGAAGVRVTPFVGSNAATPTLLTLLSVLDPTRVNASFASSSGYTGLELDLPETGLLRNLDPNPSFETNLNNTGDVDGGTLGTVNLTLSTAGGRVGNNAARATWASAATAAGGGVYHDVPVQAGITYSFADYIRTSIATRVQLQVQWLNAGGVVIGTASAGAQVVTTAAPAWSAAQRVTNENNQAPAGAVTARLRTITAAGTSYVNMSLNSWMEVDAFQVNKGATVQAYADGNSAGWEWVGAVNNSISRQAPDILTLSGMMVQILPEGEIPGTGEFYSGQGHSGCEFEGEPVVESYSAVLTQVEVGATVKLIETGAWL